jgi:hypothetical protein
MTTKNKAFQRLVVAGYLGLMLLFILIYFLAGYMPESTATLGKLLQDVALNLSIALTISFGSYALLRPFIEDSNRKTWEDFQTAALELLTLEKGVREAGVVRIYETLDDAVLKEKLNKAEERIYLLSIWLDKPEERLGSCLTDAINRGVKLKILQAQPNSDICLLRAKSQEKLFPNSSSFQPEFVTNILKDNLEYFSKLQSTFLKNVEVRVFDILPPFALILIDNQALIGLYGYGERTLSAPRIEFRLDNKNKEFGYFKHFILCFLTIMRNDL